jgi:hypothetical protein
LHRVAKEVGQQEQALLGIQAVINMDLQAVQVSGKRVGDVSCDDSDAEVIFKMLLDAGAVLGKRYFRWVCSEPAIGR